MEVIPISRRWLETNFGAAVGCTLHQYIYPRIALNARLGKEGGMVLLAVSLSYPPGPFLHGFPLPTSWQFPLS